MIKTLLVAGLLSTTVLSGHANADLSECGVNHSRLNPVELSDYQECWLDEFRGDDTSGVLGSLFWVNINDKYYSAPISTLRWDLGEAFKQSIVDDQISVAQQQAIRDAIAQLEAQIETADEVRELLAEDIITLEDYKKLDEQHKAKIAELEEKIAELKMIEVDPDAYADGYAAGQKHLLENAELANNGDVTYEGEVITTVSNSYDAGFKAGEKAAKDVKAATISWTNQKMIVADGNITSTATGINGLGNSYTATVSTSLESLGLVTKADLEKAKMLAKQEGVNSVTLSQGDALPQHTVTVTASNGQSVTVNYMAAVNTAVSNALDIQNTAEMIEFGITADQIAMINTSIAVEDVVKYAYNLGKEGVSAKFDNVAAVSDEDYTIEPGEYVKITLSNDTTYHIRATSGTISDYAAMTAIRNSIGTDDEHWDVVNDFTENCGTCTATAFVNAIYDAGYAAAPSGGSSSYTYTVGTNTITIDSNADAQKAYDDGVKSVTAEDGVSQSDVDAVSGTQADITANGDQTITLTNGNTIAFNVNVPSAGGLTYTNTVAEVISGATLIDTSTLGVTATQISAGITAALSTTDNSGKSDEWKDGFATGYSQGVSDAYDDTSPLF